MRDSKGRFVKGHNERSKTGKERSCLICGKQFYKRPYYDTVGKGKYCSTPCYRVSRRGKGKASKGAFVVGDKRIVGMNNHNWKGGKAKKNFRKTEQYKEFVQRELERSNFTCFNCGKVGGELHVHHLKSYSKFPRLRIFDGNAVVLCKNCHKQTPNYLKNYRGSINIKKVLITGVSGFIGGQLAKRLVGKDYEVAGIVRQSSRESESLNELKGKINIYNADLRDYKNVAYVVKDFQPSFICHLGAITPVSYSFSHPVEVTETNYIGTINLIEAALDHVPHLGKFIFSSSVETYGLQEPKPFTEDLELNPMCPYAVNKLVAEKYLQYIWMTTGFPVVSLRQTNCYGRVENDYFVVEAIITQMLKNPKEINLGSGETTRAFIHIDDLLDLWEVLLTNDSELLAGEVFNTGPPNGVLIGELAEMIAKKLNWKGKINWNTREKRIGEVPYLNTLNNKITNITGWSPKISLEEGLDKTINIWKQKLSST